MFVVKFSGTGIRQEKCEFKCGSRYRNKRKTKMNYFAKCNY